MLTIELNNFNLPIKIDTDFQYLSELRVKLNDYLDNIRNRRHIDGSTFNRAAENVNYILNAMNSYYNADIAAAKSEIGKILRSYKGNTYIISDLDNSPALRGFTRIYTTKENINISNAPISFFKGRVGINNYQRNEFLHIPFNKRGNVSTQRFSIAGVPCMYFGATSYVCWLELGKPADREFSIASYKVPRNIKILNLAFTQMSINAISNFQELIPYAQTLVGLFPLVIATSFKVKEENRTFRSEYIISQLIMQCLAEFEIEGVAYISKQVDNDSNNYPFCVNMAVPMKSDSDDEFFSDLANNLPLTMPLNFAEYKNLREKPFSSTNYQSYANLFNKYAHTVTYIGKNIQYAKLEFSELDNYLVNEDHKSILSE